MRKKKKPLYVADGVCGSYRTQHFSETPAIPLREPDLTLALNLASKALWIPIKMKIAHFLRLGSLPHGWGCHNPQMGTSAIQHAINVNADYAVLESITNRSLEMQRSANLGDDIGWVKQIIASRYCNNQHDSLTEAACKTGLSIITAWYHVCFISIFITYHFAQKCTNWTG